MSYNKERYAVRVNQGLCTKCGEVPASKGRLCETCYKHRLALSPNYEAKHKESDASRRAADKFAAFNTYGGPWCQCCGENILDFLTIDHVNGGGAEHRRSIPGGSGKIYSWLRQHNYPAGFQVLCSNCQNRWKTGGICPHQKPIIPEQLILTGFE